MGEYIVNHSLSLLNKIAVMNPFQKNAMNYGAILGLGLTLVFLFSISSRQMNPSCLRYCNMSLL